MMILLLYLVLPLCSGGSRAAFVEDHGRIFHPSLRLNPCHHSDQHHHSLLPPRFTSSPLFATSDCDPDTSTRAMNREEMALQLIKENSIPPAKDDNPHKSSDANHPLNSYDKDHRTPVESEFVNLMSTFLTYSERDIQSLTTTSTRYLHYPNHSQNEIHPKEQKRPHIRLATEGVRYRALYSGVQAASMEREVLRSFTVLFEDYLPIRLAGRRIYRHLTNVMEEVREERKGEIAIAREVCPSWDQSVDAGKGIIEYARNVWDTIMDESLLLDISPESIVDTEQSQEGGVISLSQIIRLGIVQVLIQEGVVNDVAELESIARQVVLQEYIEMDKYCNLKEEHDMQQVQENSKYLDLTFPLFMEVLYQCKKRKNIQSDSYPMNMLQNIEQKVIDHHTGDFNDHDTSTMLASKAVRSGSSNTCKKRKKYSDNYDSYVSKFKLWEHAFLGNNNTEIKRRQSRRLEILRGCFVGASNAKVVAALKIVYMDYAALRLAGDLIFKLMSKIAN